MRSASSLRRGVFDATGREQAVEEDARFHPDGYNPGTAAGEATMRLHVIPRYAGDVANYRSRPATPQSRSIREKSPFTLPATMKATPRAQTMKKSTATNASVSSGNICSRTFRSEK